MDVAVYKGDSEEPIVYSCRGIKDVKERDNGLMSLCIETGDLTSTCIFNVRKYEIR